MPKIKSIKQVKDLRNKKVLVRCDFDVPLENGKVSDDTRIRAALDTIKFLQKKRAAVILAGHLGRPAGEVVSGLSLEPVKTHLEKLLKQKIKFIKNFTLPASTEEIKSLKLGQVVLLENLRFWIGEEKNDKKFARSLADLADIYVNEAFAVSHREAASVAAIKKFLPSYAGLNLDEEVNQINKIIAKPNRPLVTIVGGAKIETKLPVIQKFLAKADYLLVGGAIANNFFKVLGYEVGESLVDNEYLIEAQKILERSNAGLLGDKFKPQVFNVENVDEIPLPEIKKLKHTIVLPVDVKVKNKKNKKISVKTLGEVSESDQILDIGLRTSQIYARIIKGARSIVWNGPMGYFEESDFAQGTFKLAEHVLSSRASSVIGGGETGEAIHVLLKNKRQPKRVFVSTGGGAMLEFLGGKDLPGLEGLFE